MLEISAESRSFLRKRSRCSCKRWRNGKTDEKSGRGKVPSRALQLHRKTSRALSRSVASSEAEPRRRGAFFLLWAKEKEEEERQETTERRPWWQHFWGRDFQLPGRRGRSSLLYRLENRDSLLLRPRRQPFEACPEFIWGIQNWIQEKIFDWSQTRVCRGAENFTDWLIIE